MQTEYLVPKNTRSVWMVATDKVAITVHYPSKPSHLYTTIDGAQNICLPRSCTKISISGFKKTTKFGFIPFTDINNKEHPDPTPVELPLNQRKTPLTLAQDMKRFVREELSLAADERGAETMEESDDFNVDDDPNDLENAMSEYEMDDMQEEEPLDVPEDAPKTDPLPEEPAVTAEPEPLPVAEQPAASKTG